MEKGIPVDPSDGHLLKGMKLSLNNTVEKLLHSWKPSTFAKCFPSLAANHEKSLETLRTSLLKPVEKCLYIELGLIVNEEYTEPLNRLSTIVKSSSKVGKTSWRPSGNVEDDMRAHNIKILQYEKQKLKESLQAQKNERERIMKAVLAGRGKCEANRLKIESQMSTCDEVVALCEDLPQEKIESNILDPIGSS